MFPQRDKAGDGSATCDRTGIEGRRSKRLPYRRRQRIAFGVWDRVPPDDAFIEVEFHDLSRSGCSFLYEGIPPAHAVTVELSGDEQVIYVKAQVMHATHKTLAGRELFFIGCQFQDRID